MADLVSVVVPIYNVERYLAKCLDSLLNQRYENLEILMVDDCSKDSSCEIARQYAQEHPGKCKLIQRKENGGLSAARNTGLEHASGDWVAFLDSDDWVTEDYISAMHETAVQDGADIVMSSLYYYYPDGKTVEFCPFMGLTTEDSHKLKVALCKPYANTRLYRRAFLEENRFSFPTNIRRSEDIAAIVPLLTKTKKISIVDRPMYYYLQRDTSLSNQNQKNMDLSFYPICLKEMRENSALGFETELEFRTVSELLYGKTMLMIRSGKSNREIREHIADVKKEYPNWTENPYLQMLPRAKRLFISAAGKGWYLLLRLFILVWDIKVKLKG